MKFVRYVVLGALVFAPMPALSASDPSTGFMLVDGQQQQEHMPCPGSRPRIELINPYRCVECGQPNGTAHHKLTGYGVCLLDQPCWPIPYGETHLVRELYTYVMNRREYTDFVCTNHYRAQAYSVCDCPQANSCDPDHGSPVLISLSDESLSLTDPVEGVFFDLNSNGTLDRTAWSAPGSDEAFLALDRDRDGRIGDFTLQPDTEDGLNGFNALAVFDLPANGGNGDGWIDAADDIYALLLAWVDADHNGHSSVDELSSLESAGVAGISLDYRREMTVDRHGNELRYATSVRHRDGRTSTSYDVFFRYVDPSN